MSSSRDRSDRRQRRRAFDTGDSPSRKRSRSREDERIADAKRDRRQIGDGPDAGGTQGGAPPAAAAGVSGKTEQPPNVNPAFFNRMRGNVGGPPSSSGPSYAPPPPGPPPPGALPPGVLPAPMPLVVFPAPPGTIVPLQQGSVMAHTAFAQQLPKMPNPILPLAATKASREVSPLARWRPIQSPRVLLGISHCARTHMPSSSNA